MVRKCLIWLVLMACCCVANAQEPKIGGTLDGITVKNSLRERPQTRAYAQEVFTYWSGENIGMLGAGTTDYNIAILVPAEKAGKRVEEIAIPIIDASVLTDVRVWVAEQLPQNVDTDCSVLVEVSNPSSIVVDGSLTLVSLPEPYVIPESGCYVGYSFTVTNAQTEKQICKADCILILVMAGTTAMVRVMVTLVFKCLSPVMIIQRTRQR